MATVRMQFDHEEEEEEYSGRTDNNNPHRHFEDSEESFVLTSLHGANGGSSNRRTPRVPRSKRSHVPVNITRGTDWIYALESGNFISKEDDDDYRDISFRANWTLSSCKVDGDGFGINELLSDNVDSYWQSDGPQPHTITVEFPRKTDISFLALYLDYKSDESYTPNKLLVRLGSSLMHLDDEFEQSFTEPCGWQIMDLRRGSYAKRAFVLQLQVVQNHQNGRDTHIRHMRVIGPARSRFDSVARSLVTPLVDPIDLDGDENGDPVLNGRLPMETPLMPVLTRQLKSMKVIR